MKKIMFYIFLLFMPFFVLAEDTCNQDDIKIESIVLDSTNGNIEETSNPNTDNNQVNLGLKMNVIDDSITYKLVITNTSNQDYTFDKNSLSTDYINYDITYENNSNIVKAGESKTIYLKLSYTNKPSVDKLENGVLKDNSNITFNLKKEEVESTIIEKVIKNNIVKKIVNPETGDSLLIYLIVLAITIFIIIFLVRYRKIRNISMLIILVLLTTNIVKAACTCTLNINANIEIDVKEATFLTGPELNIKMKKLSGNNNADVYTDNETIEAIVQSEEEPLTINKEENNIVSTTDSKYPIYMWYDNGTIYWWSEDKTPNLNEDSSMIFEFFLSLQNIESIKNWDSSNVKNLRSLFAFSRSIDNVDALSNWNTSNVTNINLMFNYSSSLKNIDGIKNWDVSKVTTMHQVFCGSNELEEIDLSNWETSSLEMMANMFGMWNEQGQATLESKLKRIILSDKFNTSRVENFSIAFANLPLLEDYSFLKYIDTSNATDISNMFMYNSNFNNIEYIENWDVSNVENMSLVFYKSGLSNLEGLKNWNTSKVTNMKGLFSETQVINLDELINWDTSNVTDMSYMFNNNSKLTNIEGIKNWNVSNVTNMNSMFSTLPNLEDATPINDWNINSSSSFANMFYKTTNRPTFSKVPGSWNSSGTFIPS